MKSKGFRFGLLAKSPPSRREWVEKAKETEDLGYDTLLVGEHTFDWLSPLLVLQAAANVTTRLRIGTYTLGNDFRNPVMLARDAAALDILSDGRFELGLGTGWLMFDYKNTGIPFDSPRVRVSRMQETVHILKSAFGGESFSFRGEYYHIQDFQLAGQPVQRPHPPLLIGGGGKRVLAFAAQEADIIGLNPLTTPDGWIDLTTATEQATSQKIDWIKQAARDRPDIEISTHSVITQITDNRQAQDKAISELRENWNISEAMMSRPDILASPQVLIGSEDVLVEKLLYLRDVFGISYFVFWEPLEPGARLIKRLKS